MERTRDEVVRILHDSGAASVAEVASQVGVSAGSVRRHLDLMVAEGLVTMRLERQRRGRPVMRYSLSEAGEERSAAAHYARLLERIYPALTRLPAEDAPRDGAALLASVFDGIAEDIARSYAPRVHGETLDQRVAQVGEALKEEGILTGVLEEDEHYRLMNVGCPYRSTAEGTHVACDADRRTIELLLGKPVTQVTTIVAGAPSCEYVVSKLHVQTQAPSSDTPAVAGGEPTR